MLRIAYFIDDLIHGGTQTWLTILAEGLHGLGYEQRVYCMRKRAHPQNVQRLQQWAKVSIIGEPRLWSVEGLIYLYRDLRHWRPDIVQTILPTSDVLGRVLGRVAGRPMIVSSIRSINSHKSRWQLGWDRLTARWACRVIFNSREAIPFALAHEGVTETQVVYIPNGVYFRPDLTGFQDLSGLKAILRKQLGLSSDSKVVGMVARLDPKKGLLYLLAAFALVIRQIPEAVLLIIGDGPLRKTLTREANHLNIITQVYFLGDRSDVPDLLALLDVYVHSSVSEAMPNAVLEAMAAAKPIVATRVGSVTELIVDGESGWLVEPANPASLAERIIYALQHEAEARRGGLTAAERVRNHFSVDRMIAAYHELYQQLIAETRR